MNHAEISALVIPLLKQCGRDGREHIAGLAVAAALETYPPEERYRVLDDAMQTFRRLLPDLAID